MNFYNGILLLFLLILIIVLFLYNNKYEAQKKDEINIRVEIKQGEKYQSKDVKLFYYLNKNDFCSNLIEIDTNPIRDNNLTNIYLFGNVPIYNYYDYKVGTCSTSFNCIGNQDIIMVDISNSLRDNSGLIISWTTPAMSKNYTLNSVIDSMASEAIVTSKTKVGQNPFFGKQFYLVVSAHNNKICFNLKSLN